MYTTVLSIIKIVDKDHLHYSRKASYTPLKSVLFSPFRTLATTNLLYVARVLLFSECRINGTVQYVDSLTWCSAFQVCYYCYMSIGSVYCLVVFYCIARSVSLFIQQLVDR